SISAELPLPDQFVEGSEKGTTFCYRELTFKHPNGAYIAWRPNGYGSSDGSNWLTAYVVRVFTLSDEYIFIDPTEQQIGSMIHKHMHGVIISGNKPIALTGFILLALLEAGRSPTSQSVEAAIDCLDAQSLIDMGTYALDLSAYAYTVYGENPARRQQLMKELYNREIVEDTSWNLYTGSLIPYMNMCTYSLSGTLNSDRTFTIHPSALSNNDIINKP
ncbi:hypothetical protein LSH36_1438g00007, partial [Paralvinella palmiformis]